MGRLGSIPSRWGNHNSRSSGLDLGEPCPTTRGWVTGMFFMKNRKGKGGLLAALPRILRRANVLRLPALGALGHIELDGLAFL